MQAKRTTHSSSGSETQSHQFIVYLLYEKKQNIFSSQMETLTRRYKSTELNSMLAMMKGVVQTL